MPEVLDAPTETEAPDKPGLFDDVPAAQAKVPKDLFDDVPAVTSKVPKDLFHDVPVTGKAAETPSGEGLEPWQQEVRRVQAKTNERSDVPLLNLVNPLSPEEDAALLRDHPKLHGVFHSIESNANALTTPANLALLAAGGGIARLGKWAARGVALAFATLMGKQVPEIATELGKEYAKPPAERDQSKIANLISSGTIATGFTSLLGAHAVGKPLAEATGMAPDPKLAKLAEGMKAQAQLIRDVAPLTANAIEAQAVTPAEPPSKTPGDLGKESLAREPVGTDAYPPEAKQFGVSPEKWKQLADWQKDNVRQQIDARKKAAEERGQAKAEKKKEQARKPETPPETPPSEPAEPTTPTTPPIAPVSTTTQPKEPDASQVSQDKGPTAPTGLQPEGSEAERQPHLQQPESGTPDAPAPSQTEKVITADTYKHLTPAIQTEDGTIHTGGTSHAEVSDTITAKNTALPPEADGFNNVDGFKEGFVDENDNFVTRQDGAKWFKAKTGKETGKPGELHSEDLKAEGLLGHLEKAAKEGAAGAGTVSSADPRTMSDEAIAYEKKQLEDASAPHWAALDAMGEEAYSGKNASPTPEAKAILDKLEPFSRRKELLDSEATRRANEIRNKEMFAARDKRVAEAPVFQKRNGWEIVKEGVDYVLRHPDSKEDVYRGKLSRVREVADESKPEPLPPSDAPPEQKPPPEPGPGTGEGPGTPPAGFQTKAQIEQLTDAFKGIAAKKAPLAQQVKEAFSVGDRLSTAKDAIGKALSALKASGDFLRRKFEGVNTVDEMLRAKGELSKEIEARGWRVRQWVKQASKAVPSRRDQAAIAKWIDAGGDAAELRRGMAETKPQFRQAYEDALNLKGDLLKAAQDSRAYHEARLDEAIDAGVLKDGVEDYLHRIYESRPGLAAKAIAYVQTGLLKTNPALTKKRVFQFDWEAEKLGYKPVQSFIPRIAQYESSLSRAIAAREFIKKSTTMKAPDGRPVIDVKGVGIPIEDPAGIREGTLIKPQFNPARQNQPGTPAYRGDYVNKEFPALSKWKWVSSDAAGKPIYVQGDVAIHPDYVNRVAALLEPSRVKTGRFGTVLRPALKASSVFKQTMLDLSGFHQVQIAVHAMEHKVNPFNLVQDIDFDHPDVDGLLKGGVTLGGDYYAKEGLVGASLTRQIPMLGPLMESYHSWLFQDFIPRIKMTMALKALERNRERYASTLNEEQIFNKTAMQANSAFGELNYTMLERSATARDMARLIMLAPDFLEARGRFAAEAFSKGGKNFGNEQRSALLLGALTMYVAARVANKVTDDQWHFEPENMFSVVHNGRAYGLRTVQGDILHLVSNPLSFWMHRLNPVFGRTALEAMTSRDEFGRKRSVAEQMWDAVSNIRPIALRSSRERTIWESLANSFGITDRRWQDTDKAFEMARSWKSKHGIGDRGEFIYDADKDPLRPLKVSLSRNDDAAAAKEIKKLVDGKVYTLEKLTQYFDRYSNLAFTGSRANDQKWLATLSDDEKKTVEAARQHKIQIRDLYRKARGKYRAAALGEPEPAN